MDARGMLRPRRQPPERPQENSDTFREETHSCASENNFVLRMVSCCLTVRSLALAAAFEYDFECSFWVRRSKPTSSASPNASSALPQSSPELPAT